MKLLLALTILSLSSMSFAATSEKRNLKPGRSIVYCNTVDQVNTALMSGGFDVPMYDGKITVFVKHPFSTSAPTYSERGFICVTVTQLEFTK